MCACHALIKATYLLTYLLTYLKAGSLEDPVNIVTYAPLYSHYYRPKNCSELWLKFYSSFAYKGACDFDINSYDEFIRAARHNVSALNKVRSAMLCFSMPPPTVGEVFMNCQRVVLVSVSPGSVQTMLR